MKDGGPAFPNVFTDKSGPIPHTHVIDGMSLRDWFAGMIASGLIQTTLPPDMTDALASQFCYHFADAMLAEREKKVSTE